VNLPPKSNAPVQGVIRVARRRPWIRDRLATYHVLIDDVDRGKVRSGSTVDFLVSPGERELFIRSGTRGSQSEKIVVSLSARNVLSFVCGTNGSILSIVSDSLSSDPWISLDEVY
jgi:hypothetical protein